MFVGKISAPFDWAVQLKQAQFLRSEKNPFGDYRTYWAIKS